MNNHTDVLLTKEGLSHLKKEYDSLVNEKRPNAVKRMAAAREQGDLSENSEYTAAKEDLAFIDGRIIELEDLLHKAKLITVKPSRSHIDVGSKVTLATNGKRDVFTLVGEWEADPKVKKISHSSPLGKALMGKKVGDAAEVAAPAGKLFYKVIHIE